ncbi:ribonuclease P protein subunit p29-like [Lontra canadensis]|uniref:ribonuclease P protein subunit p29-like n=1 Tax=Lontra canadensis TaxID=76717 RepID=UPI0013F37474|nr:ribonuclease P protein subunit p29-like [Lontra canadensis]
MTVNAAFGASWLQKFVDLCAHSELSLMVNTEAFCLPSRQPHMVQTKLFKADLHGALVSVTKSKCPSYVGITGILLQETKHVFKILTKEDRLKVIPKLNCVFAVEIDGFISYIYGSKFPLWLSE